MVSEALIEVKRGSRPGQEGLRVPLKRLVGSFGRGAGARVPWHALLAPRRRSRAEIEPLLRWPSGRADGLEVMRQALGAQEAGEALLVEDGRQPVLRARFSRRSRVKSPWRSSWRGAYALSP